MITSIKSGKILFIIICIVLTCISACQKELKCENCNTSITDTNNKPPVANAGTDQAITLPVDSIILDGSHSFDPEGIIKDFFWSKIAGPASFSIQPQNVALTKATNLTQGNYQFELIVTDAGGLKTRDTVSVLVYPASPLIGNMIFFFTDPTGSINPVINFTLDPSLVLATVKIANYPDGAIRGVWCDSCAPRCPISSDYNADEENYTSFDLPPGTYSWTATTVVRDLSNYPIPQTLVQFMTSQHTAQGTVTIGSNDQCVIQEINF